MSTKYDYHDGPIDDGDIEQAEDYDLADEPEAMMEIESRIAIVVEAIGCGHPPVEQIRRRLEDGESCDDIVAAYFADESTP